MVTRFRPRPLPAALRWRRAFPALRHRNFRLFLGGQFISLSGTWMQSVAHGWLVLTLTGSPFLVGLVPAIGSLPILVFTLYGGVVADRVHRHRFILILQSLMVIEASTLFWLTWHKEVTVAWVLGLAIFYGFLSAFEVPARQAFVVEMVGKDDLMNAIALNSSIFNLTRVFGPAIAGVIIATLGLAACFLANALSYVAVIGGLLLMRLPPPAPPAASPATVRQALGQGFRYLLDEPWPRTLMILTGISSIFGYPFITMLPVYARDVAHVGAGGYGALVSAVGVGAAAGALAVAGFGRRIRQERMALLSATVFGTLLIVTAFVPRLWIAMVLLVGVGCAMAIQGISANTFLQRSAPDELRGRVMGFYSFVALGLAPFGTLLAGWVADRAGVRASLALGGLVCLLAALGLKRLRRGHPFALPVSP